MDGYSERKPIIVVGGPTASGKTAVAIELSQRLNGEIISADSMQIYRTLDIGTAKPTSEERAAAVHHLVNIKNPEELYSVADFVKDANEASTDIYSRGKLPIICGGTGLYISSFINGIAFIGEKTDMELRERLYEEYEKNGIEPFLREIEEKDEKIAKTLHPNNVKRILRTVERLRATSLTDEEIIERSRQKPCGYEPLLFVLCPERAKLYESIEKRIDLMVVGGLLEEAKCVFDNKNSYKTAAQAIGYKEFFNYFEGKSSIAECVTLLKQATRRYAKRQITWFRREKDAIWLDPSSGAEETAKQIIARFHEAFDDNKTERN